MKDSYKKDVERIILKTLSIVRYVFENFDRYDVLMRIDFVDNQCSSYNYHFLKYDYKSILSELIKIRINKNVFTSIGRIDIYCTNGATISCWLNYSRENNNIEIKNIEIYYKYFKIRIYKSWTTTFDEFFICVFCNERSVFCTTLNDKHIGVNINSISSIYNDVYSIIINIVNTYHNNLNKFSELGLPQDDMYSNNILNKNTITEEEVYDFLRKF